MGRFFQLMLAATAVLSIPGSASADGPTPPSSPPLNGEEIVALLDGKTFAFKAYDAPLSGTSHWDSKPGTVSGDYVYDGSAGTYKSGWNIKDDKSCTKSEGQPEACQTIYAYEGGFMEVNPDGSVHAVSVPK